MTIWKRVVFCDWTPTGERFTVIERALGSSAVRRPAAMRYSEDELRRVLGDLGETAEGIEVLLAQARSGRDW